MGTALQEGDQQLYEQGKCPPTIYDSGREHNRIKPRIPLF